MSWSHLHYVVAVQWEMEEIYAASSPRSLRRRHRESLAQRLFSGTISGGGIEADPRLPSLLRARASSS